VATHEKIIKRVDGSRVKITVEFSVSFFKQDAKYSVSVEKCEKGKRTWKYCLDRDSNTYRKLNQADRIERIKKANLELVSPEEIFEAKMELWQKLKPVMGEPE